MKTLLDGGRQHDAFADLPDFYLPTSAFKPAAMLLQLLLHRSRGKLRSDARPASLLCIM